MNEQLARHYWPGQDPIGKRFRLNDSRGPWVEIVGVTKTSTYIFIDRAANRVCLLPLQAAAVSLGWFCWRIHRAIPASLAMPLRDVVRTSRREPTDLRRPHHGRVVSDAGRRPILDVISKLVGAMGIMGLGLAIVGLYGLVAYAAEPADQGDRHPHGDRRGPAGRVADGPATRHDACRCRPRPWPGRERRRGSRPARSVSRYRPVTAARISRRCPSSPSPCLPSCLSPR